MQLLKVRGIEKLSQEDLQALCKVCEELSIFPSWLATVISFETGGSFSPSQRNAWAAKEALRTGKPYSGAVGLIQFMPSTAKNLGTSSEALAKMTFQQQLFFVKRYLSSYKGRMKSLEDTYLAVFFPLAMGKDDSFVVGIKEGGTSFQANVYKQNAGFDSQQTGKITRGMICSTIRRVRDLAQDKTVEVVYSATPPPVVAETRGVLDMTILTPNLSTPPEPSLLISWIKKLFKYIF